MKVVLFCGGMGLRLRELGDIVPKPMVPVGDRPILWHVMRYYAHFGHADFVLCLGYRAGAIKEYFLNHRQTLSRDFVLSHGLEMELVSSDIDQWNIRFIDTGVRASIGQRLGAVRRHLENDEMFLANYGDVLTDAPLNELVDDFRSRGKLAAFLSVRPTNYTFHVVRMKDDHLVDRLDNIADADLRVNGGYFVFRREIFDYMQPGEDLVEAPFRRLAEAGQLVAYRYDGFWAPMDTLRDVSSLESMVASGNPPWAVWQDTERLAGA